MKIRIGAGNVGCACAMAAVTRDSARTIVLVNRTRKTAEAVATDMRYGTPLGPKVDIADGDYDALKGAGVVLITSGVNERTGGATDRSNPQGRLKLLGKNAEIYRDIVPRIVKAEPDAVLQKSALVCATARELSSRPLSGCCLPSCRKRRGRAGRDPIRVAVSARQARHDLTSSGPNLNQTRERHVAKRRHRMRGSVGIALIAIALGLSAQNAAAQLADKKVLTLAAAQKMVAAAQAEAERRSLAGVIAVVDDGGWPILVLRMDNAAFVASVELAPGKARTAALFKKPSQALEDSINHGRIAAVTARGFVEMQGGLPIVVDGQVVGGIGASFDTPEHDVEIAKAGLAALTR
jgi:glc operon protein GlcG